MPWTYDTAPRLEDLVGRCRAQEAFLTRERADHPEPTARAALDARLEAIRRRLRRLCRAARVARRVTASRAV